MRKNNLHFLLPVPTPNPNIGLKISYYFIVENFDLDEEYIYIFFILACVLGK